MDTVIDVRSDTVTKPDEVMRKAMASAPVGDDVYGDDPSVNRLQQVAAELLGHEAALFMPSGTQSNLVALMTHCQRGDEYIVGADAHTYKYEGGGAAALGGIQPQPVAMDDNGGLPLDTVAAAIKKDDVHFARSRLLSLENTQYGRVQPLEQMQAARKFSLERGLKLHLDGARMANAAVKLGVSLADIATCFDSVSLCLSKGLGAPVGSLLVSSKTFIEEAKRWRKVTGGGLRQAGVLAAAGHLALTQGVSRLQDDHDKAARLSDALTNTPGLTVRTRWTQTNMVWLDFNQACGETLAAAARSQGILMSAQGTQCRLVVHRDVSVDQVEQLIKFIRDYFQQQPAARVSNG